MIALLQKVKYAKVSIDKKLYSQINKGILIFLGIHSKDIKKDVEYLVKKIIKARIFSDTNNKMNFDILTIKGSMLVVSQFTLYGNLKKGNRPSFLNAAKPNIAKPIYHYFVSLLKEYNIKIETGKFGAEMDIDLNNNGPVTLIINSHDEKKD